MVHAEGSDCLEWTIWWHFYHPQLCEEIWQQVGSCAVCEAMKKIHPQVGQLASQEVPHIPWFVHANSIRPWAIKIPQDKKLFKVNALTIIDPVTNLVKIIRQRTKTTLETVCHLNNDWLSRYPRPFKFVADSRPSAELEFMLMDAGIKWGISLCILRQLILSLRPLIKLWDKSFALWLLRSCLRQERKWNI